MYLRGGGGGGIMPPGAIYIHKKRVGKKSKNIYTMVYSYLRGGGGGGGGIPGPPGAIGFFF